jgi:hypothetical protein
MAIHNVPVIYQLRKACASISCDRLIFPLSRQHRILLMMQTC